MDDYKHYNRPAKDKVGRLMFWLGIIGLIALAYSCAIEESRRPQPAMLKSHNYNPWHPDLTTYVKYRRFHQPPQQQDPLLAELVEVQ